MDENELLKRQPRSRRIRRIIILALTILFMAYFFRSQNNHIQVTRISVEADVDSPLRIVHITDLHNKEFGKDNIRLVNAIVRQRPHLIVMTGDMIDENLRDMAIVQRYAELNRRAIVREIVKAMKFKTADSFTTVHNYIDLDSMILRKGAISAKAGECVLIPINMRDGSLICVGKGNPDWNYSAPHGAGRLMSRSAAKASFTLTQYEKSMEGIYSSTVNKSTIDEAPMAYKPMEEIIGNIGDTAEITCTVKPLYNFKAAE